MPTGFHLTGDNMLKLSTFRQDVQAYQGYSVCWMGTTQSAQAVDSLIMLRKEQSSASHECSSSLNILSLYLQVYALCFSS